MALRGRPSTHAIDRYRSLAWYAHVKKHSDQSDYWLNKRFGPVHMDELARVRCQLFERIRKGERLATVELVDQVEAALTSGSAEYFHAEFWELLKRPDPSIRMLLKKADAFFSRVAIARIMPRDAKLLPKLKLPKNEYAAYNVCLDVSLATLGLIDRATALCLLTHEAKLAQDDFYTRELYVKLQAMLLSLFQEFLPRNQAMQAYRVAHEFLYSSSSIAKDEEWLRWQAEGWVDRFLVPHSYLLPRLVLCPVRRQSCALKASCDTLCISVNARELLPKISTGPKWFDA